MGLLDLVQQHHGVRLAPHGLGELTAFLVPDVAWRRSDESGDRVPLNELAHVDLDQVIFAAEHEFSQCLGQQRFTDAGWSQEDERADWPTRILQPGASAAHGLRKGRDRLFLSDDPRVQILFHLEEALRFLAGDPGYRDASPHRHHFGDVFLRDVHLILGVLIFDLLLLRFDAFRAGDARDRATRRQARSPAPLRPLPDHAESLRDRVFASFRLGGAADRIIRTRLDASSIRSMALSGMKRSVTYRAAMLAAAFSASSVILSL